MLTPYERSRLDEALDCMRVGLCPRNLEELAQIFERCLEEASQVTPRKAQKSAKKESQNYILDGMVCAHSKLKGLTRSQLIEVCRTINCWGWHPLMGDRPSCWEELPDYQRAVGDHFTITKADILVPYSAALRELGVTHWDTL